MAVAQKPPAGTMTEGEERSKVSSSPEDKTPAEEKVSPEEDPKIYSQTQADALLHAAKSEWGRTTETIERERDGFKSQVVRFQSQLEENKTDIETLEQKLDDMSSDDPKRYDATKELKAAREEKRQLKAKISALDEREDKLSSREKRVNAFERDVLVETIADEFEDGDVNRLKKAVSVFENPTEEQIRTIAGIFWKKKTGEEEPKKKALKGMSPFTVEMRGGLPYFTREQIGDRKFYEAHREEILKANAEGRIKD